MKPVPIPGPHETTHAWLIEFHISPKGVTVKESEISRGLVSPAQRALKKFCTLAQIRLENHHQAHAHNG